MWAKAPPSASSTHNWSSLRLTRSLVPFSHVLWNEPHQQDSRGAVAVQGCLTAWFRWLSLEYGSSVPYCIPHSFPTAGGNFLALILVIEGIIFMKIWIDPFSFSREACCCVLCQLNQGQLLLWERSRDYLEQWAHYSALCPKGNFLASLERL